MNCNVEIKARVPDIEKLAARAQLLTGSPAQILVQEDIFFNCPSARFKLRTINDAQAELIYYQRPSVSGPKLSNYICVPVEISPAAREMFATMLGIKTIVRKRRRLYLYGNTRIHLDEVEGLGNFMELEVVLEAAETESQGTTRAHEVMSLLGIDSSKLITGAYADLK